MLKMKSKIPSINAQNQIFPLNSLNIWAGSRLQSK
jgi:hypothetical protein